MKTLEQYYFDCIITNVKDFIEYCETHNKNWQEELNKVLADGQKYAGIKDVRQLV